MRSIERNSGKFAVDMSEVVPENIIDVEEGEVIETSNE